RARRGGDRRRRHHADRQRVCTGACAAGAGPGPPRAGGAGPLRGTGKRGDPGQPARDGGEVTVQGAKLGLDPAMVRAARDLARIAGQPIVDMARSHSTVSVERAVLRLAGLDGADGGGMPWVNRLVDAVRETTGLEHGVALPAWDALAAGGYPSLSALGRGAGGGPAEFRAPAGRGARGALARGLGVVDARRAQRESMIAEISAPPRPWIYLIVATGDIYEDIPQAQAAAREGADVIAVIRSTGQSLLDYVPEGATRE